MILENDNYNYYNLENDYKKIIFNYNNIIHSSTKFKPIFYFLITQMNCLILLKIIVKKNLKM